MPSLSPLIKAVFFRGVLPLALLSAAVIRPSFISLAYGVLALLCPLFPAIATPAGTNGLSRAFLTFTLLCCCLGGIAQLAFQIFLEADGHYTSGSRFKYQCKSTNESYTYNLFQFGLQELPSDDPGNSARILLPDIIAFVFAVITFIVCVVFGNQTSSSEDERITGEINRSGEFGEGSSGPASRERLSTEENAQLGRQKMEANRVAQLRSRIEASLRKFSDLFGFLLLGIVGTIYPCGLSFLYFAQFLFLLTWWSIYRPIRRAGFNRIKGFIIGYAFIHLVILYICQIPTLQDSINGDAKMARLVGLTSLVKIECLGAGKWDFTFIEGSEGWQKYANPILLVFFYYYIIAQLKATYTGVGRRQNYEEEVNDQRSGGPQIYPTDGDSALLLSGEEDPHGHNELAPRPNITRLHSVMPLPENLSSRVGSKGSPWFYQIIYGAITFFIRHSYAITLITMIAWAVGFHSALAFVWLILSCLVWSLPNTQKICYNLSPFIVTYAEILLLIQYFYSLDWNESELPFYENKVIFKIMQDVGLVKYAFATCFPLWIKIGFALPYFVTLRLFLREKFYERLPGMDAEEKKNYGTFGQFILRHDTTGPTTRNSWEDTEGWLEQFFGKYWIYVVAIVLIAVSVKKPFTIFSVGYMFFFVILITILQLSARALRLVIFGFWSLLLLYSGLMLSWLYIFQFSSVCTKFVNVTSNAEIWQDLGLPHPEKCASKADWRNLLELLVSPLACLGVVALQCKFFHGLWRQITDPAHGQPRVEVESVNCSGSWVSSIRSYWRRFTDLAWRFAEIHVWKLVVFSFIMLSTFEVCAVNLVLVIVMALMLPGRIGRGLLCLLASIWLSIIVLVKLLVQLSSVPAHQLQLPFDNLTGCQNTPMSNQTVTEWLGFEKVDKTVPNEIGNYLQGYIIVLVILGLQAIVHARQQYRREVDKTPTPAPGVLFPNITRPDADKSVMNCIYYLINYAFYKFGVEICFITTVVVAAIRMDGVAFFYIVWLVILFSLRRSTMAKVWYIYVLMLIIALPVQYAICVRIPCFPWPWMNVLFFRDHQVLINWLYLPNNEPEQQQNAKFLIADFIQLLFACCQIYVFSVERSVGAFDGGENKEVWRELNDEEETAQNPTHDFVTYCRSSLDLFKCALFGYFHWITMVMAFLAGLGAVSIFALGYLIAVFLFLWKGNDLYVKEKHTVIRLWRSFVYYNLLVIVLKVGLQSIACAFNSTLQQKGYCWLIQLLSLSCIGHPVSLDRQQCTISDQESDITYDAVAFAFFIFQLKIMGSFYFRHVIAEFKAERVLSSRGAVLINQLILKEMKSQNEAENKRLKRIKWKAKAIRAHYEKNANGKEYLPDPETYAEAKRAGDYYMFDVNPDHPEESDLGFGPDSYAPDPTPGSEDTQGLGPLELLHVAASANLDFEAALKGVDRAEKSGVDKDKRVTIAIREDESSQEDDDEPSPDFIGPPAVEDEEEPTSKDKKKSKKKKKPAASQEDLLPETSKDSTCGEGDEEEEENAGIKGKIMGCFRFLLKFLTSFLDWMTAFFNRRSRDHRYVAFVLGREKKKLKELVADGQLEAANVTMRSFRKNLNESEEGKKIHSVKTEADIARMEKEADNYWKQNNVAVRFLVALGYLAISRTELLCYLIIFLNQMQNAALLSIPLPLLALFWGTLCSPRPPKFFWIVMIAYTEGLVVIKFLFQFHFFAWKGDDSKDPFYPPKIIGIERTNLYAFWDVILLIMLFFHRYMMRRLGLWKDAEQSAALEDTSGVMELNSPDSLDNSVESETKDPEAKEDNGHIELQNMSPREMDPGKSTDLDCISASDVSPSTKSPFLAYFGTCGSFYSRLLHPRFRYIRDLYPFIFLTDLICLIICTFGYNSFGVASGSGDVLQDVKTNRVPMPWVLLLISLTILIIIDRGLYLRKSVVGKLLFQHFLVVGVHIFVFFVLPSLNEKSIKENYVAQLWYFVKCIYFLFSAWQIRNGFPSQVIGNLLTKSYNIVCFVLFSVFWAAPFLFEIRTIIDWIWTDTSMPIFDFFTMENFYAMLYKLKCGRKLENDFPARRGEAKGAIIKYLMGGGMLFVIILIVFLPLLLYALLNYIGASVPPESAKLSISIQGYPPLYSMVAQGDQYLSKWTNSDQEFIMDTFGQDKGLSEWLGEFTFENILRAKFREESLTTWGASEPAKQQLKEEMQNCVDAKKESPLKLLIKWEFSRPRYSNSMGLVHEGSHLIPMGKYPSLCSGIYNLLNKTGNASVVIVPFAYPPYIHLPAEGKAENADKLLGYYSSTSMQAYANVSLYYTEDGDFWRANTKYATNCIPQGGAGGNSCPSKPSCCIGPPYRDQGLQIVAFVDKLFPSWLGSVVAGGIIAMYLAVVLVVSRVIRGMVVGSALDVILKEMPYVDRCLKICYDIYLVREARDFILEQDLYAKLIFLFRSPETLIKWTRMPRKTKEE